MGLQPEPQRRQSVENALDQKMEFRLVTDGGDVVNVVVSDYVNVLNALVALKELGSPQSILRLGEEHGVPEPAVLMAVTGVVDPDELFERFVGKSIREMREEGAAQKASDAEVPDHVGDLPRNLPPF